MVRFLVGFINWRWQWEKLHSTCLCKFRSDLWSAFFRWPRALSMVRALCELQLELQCPLSSVLVAETDNSSSFKSPAADIEHFASKMPAGKEKREPGKQKSSLISGIRNAEVETGPEENASFTISCAEMSGSQGMEKLSTNFPSSNKKEDFHKLIGNCRASTESYELNSCLTSDVQSYDATLLYLYISFGNFPSPRELASLDEKILAKRYKLGYRASRIVNLARSIIEGRIQLKHLEEACSRPSLSNYNKLAEQLKEINGSLYMCQVLMCMGFYLVVPSDSETIGHINQVKVSI